MKILNAQFLDIFHNFSEIYYVLYVPDMSLRNKFMSWNYSNISALSLNEVIEIEFGYLCTIYLYTMYLYTYI